MTSLKSSNSGKSRESRSFYKLMWPTTGPWGIAYALPPLRISLHPNEELLPNWSIPTFQLRGGPFAEYLANNEGAPLCSEVMRDIIEIHRHPSDLIEWLPVEVVEWLPMEVNGDNASRHYFILHLLEELDVVDLSKSMIAKGSPLFVVKPHLDLTRVGNHQIFKYKGGGDFTVCLSDKIRSALLKQGCTGCHFWRIPAS